MSMTKEEAITCLQEKYDYCKSFYDLAAHPEEDYPEMAKYLQALQIALTALRPVSREQVEKVWKTKWKKIDPYKHYPYPGGIVECPSCGLEIDGCYENYNFCPRCGAAATDKAVDMVMERLEEICK